MNHKYDRIEIIVKNRFSVSDNLELMTPKGNISFNLSDMVDKKGNSVDVAPGDGHIVYIVLPEEFKNIDCSYGLLMRCV